MSTALFISAGNLTLPALVPAKGNDNIDSLIQVAKKAREDTSKVDLLIEISWQYRLVNPTEGVKWGENSYTLSDKLKFKRGMARSCNAIGLNYTYIPGKYEKALEYFMKALKIANEIKDKQNISKSIFNIAGIGVHYLEDGDYPKALEFYNKSIELAEKYNVKEPVAKSLRGIGRVYLEQNEYLKALESLQKSLDIYEELGNDFEIATTYSNMGITYSYYMSDYTKALECNLKSLKICEKINYKDGISVNLVNIGSLYANFLNDDNKALEYYFKALIILEELGYKQKIIMNLGNIADRYDNMSEPTKAYEYYSKALQMAEELGDKYCLALVNSNFGLYFYNLNQFSKALQYVNKSYLISKEIDNKMLIDNHHEKLGLIYYKLAVDSSVTDSSRNNKLLKSADYLKKAVSGYHERGEMIEEFKALRYLSETYIKLGDFKRALESFAESKNIQDTVFTQENKQKFANMIAVRENELKQKEIMILQQKNEIQELNMSKQQQEMSLLKSRQEVQDLELQKQYDQLNILEKDNKLKTLESEKKDKDLLVLNKEKAYQLVLSRSLKTGLAGSILVLVMLFLFFMRKRRDNRLLAEKNKQISAQKEQLENSYNVIQSDLEQAKEYVLSLLPQKLNEGALKTDWIFIPSSSLGGDAIGYMWIDNEHFAFYILDVCGHGIGPALHSVSVMHFIRSGSQLNIDLRKPDIVVSSVNNAFQSEDHNGMFFTMWYGVLNIKSGNLSYVCAGHPAPLLKYENGDTILLDPPSMTVGCVSGINYVAKNVQVHGRAELFLFSDGTFEIIKPDKKSMLVDEFYNILKTTGTNGTELNHVHEHMAEIQGSKIFEDDFSILKVKLAI
jgi:serine phosphatase RsbU (regulator of sigma subunit)/sulfur relay (sulfurtransferase) complex TusBCD TusD component (DsrE family)